MVPRNRVGQSWTPEIAASDIAAVLGYLCLVVLLKAGSKVNENPSVALDV